MLPVDAETVRLTLHVLGACVWIGGQFVLAVEVSVVRAHGGREATRAVARRFQVVAWPAYVVLVATGIWNLLAVAAADQSTEYLTTLSIKLALVVAAGVGAAAHTVVSRTRPALGGALAGFGLAASVAAAFVGVALGSG